MAEPFTIHVPDTVLDDLQERLARTRLPDELPNVGWRYGTKKSLVERLIRHWRTDFDWRAAESRLNQFSHFKMEVRGMNVHFIHQTPAEGGGRPLLLLHGWPGSVFEFHKILPLLTTGPETFTVVAPSLPGYGWSDAPMEAGFDVIKMADLFHDLMKALGYRKYYVQGGDWGSIIATNVAMRHPRSCQGLHVNMCVVVPPKLQSSPLRFLRFMGQLPFLSAADKAALASTMKFAKYETGYQDIQGTKPQTLGYGLNDSPVGLLAWIVEKLRTWSDCGGDVESVFTMDEILTEVMIYWINGNITSSMRLYYETLGKAEGKSPSPILASPVTVPTGVAIFPGELYKVPRGWAELQYNVTHWSPMPRGGHFAAWECPDLLAADVKRFCFHTVKATKRSAEWKDIAWDSTLVGAALLTSRL